jgi:hypothetical protein
MKHINDVSLIRYIGKNQVPAEGRLNQLVAFVIKGFTAYESLLDFA